MLHRVIGWALQNTLIVLLLAAVPFSSARLARADLDADGVPGGPLAVVSGSLECGDRLRASATFVVARANATSRTVDRTWLDICEASFDAIRRRPYGGRPLGVNRGKGGRL